MTEFLQVSTAIDSMEGARKIAEFLVSKRLAACVHVSGPITSTYWWQDKMETAHEWVCLAKTRKELYNAVEQAIRVVHPYEVPEIVAIPILMGNASYLDWIIHETSINA